MSAAFCPSAMVRGSNVVRIQPELHFPVGEVFHVRDDFNGKQRGEYYFRSRFTGHLRGPFINELTARLAVNHENDGA